jgi:hypothetical protein
MYILHFFLVRLVRLKMDNFSLFLSQQTDKQQNFRLHDEQMVKERRLPWLPFPV